MCQYVAETSQPLLHFTSYINGYNLVKRDIDSMCRRSVFHHYVSTFVSDPEVKVACFPFSGEKKGSLANSKLLAAQEEIGGLYSCNSIVKLYREVFHPELKTGVVMDAELVPVYLSLLCTIVRVGLSCTADGLPTSRYASEPLASVPTVGKPFLNSKV